MDSIKCGVKFTERYGKAAHEITEKMNMAAELLYCSREASVGLFVVITRFYECDLRAPLSDEVLQQLEDGLKTLHDKNLVHGDLRRPNILTDEEGRVRLIDFEWSGEAGMVRYPALVRMAGGCQSRWLDSATARPRQLGAIQEAARCGYQSSDLA